MKDRIKLVRQKEGKNQTEFGAKIGVSGAAVSRWEAGDRAIPDSAIRSICREFNINEKWLREGTEPMKAENSTAAEAGLQRGDLILTANGEYVDDIRELYAVINGLKAGDWLTLGICRDGVNAEVSFRLMEAASPLKN